MVLNQIAVSVLITIIFSVVPFPVVTNYTPYWFVVAKYGKSALDEMCRAGLHAALQTSDFRTPIVKYIPEAWVFALVWPIYYGLLIASSFVFWNNFFGADLWTAWYICLIVHIAMLRSWSFVFYGSDSKRGLLAGLLVVLAAWLTGGALLVFYWIEKAWLSLGLFAAPVLWLSFATFLNAQFVTKAGYIMGECGINIYNHMVLKKLVTRRIDIQVNSVNSKRP